MDKNNPAAVDTYISRYPPQVQRILEQIRAEVRAVAPGAGETVAYGVPTFTLNGNLVHFGAYARHIGFYPTSSGISHFSAELAGYKTSRGAVQFPIDQPMPLDLIRRITRYRVEENLQKARVQRRKQ